MSNLPFGTPIAYNDGVALSYAPTHSHEETLALLKELWEEYADAMSSEYDYPGRRWTDRQGPASLYRRVEERLREQRAL